jgi:CIC family chloride channel protein
MIANLVSYFVASRFQKLQIYEILAHQDGIHLPTKESKHQDASRQVRFAMRDPDLVLAANWKVNDALGKIAASNARAWPVSDERGLLGMLRLADLEAVIQDSGDETLEDLLTGGEFPHLHADHSLSAALDRMGAARLDVLPVVSRANIRELEGVVTLKDVLNLYGLREAD